MSIILFVDTLLILLTPLSSGPAVLPASNPFNRAAFTSVPFGWYELVSLALAVSVAIAAATAMATAVLDTQPFAYKTGTSLNTRELDYLVTRD